ncbi:helix-turn-helix transcriptional regulator [Candidatus Woesearchaeota archaeon]|nr:helix-turn-helix transcriptional regulator [Candidatus Woesearchaeota archaeon]
MGTKNFLLLSLEDAEAKKVANIVSNDSCRKILDYLSDKEATESELAEKLSIPISTIHYNLQQLTEAKLVEAEEFHYSPKGREVNHYKLANKYIIITPKKVTGIRQKLRSILPAGLIAIGAAGIIQLLSKYMAVQPGIAPMMAQEAAPEMARIAAKAAVDEAAQDSMMLAAPVAEPIAQTASIWQNAALWFLIGAVAALTVYTIIRILRKED